MDGWTRDDTMGDTGHFNLCWKTTLRKRTRNIMLTLCPVRVMPLCKLLFVLIFDYEAMVIIIYECYTRCTILLVWDSRLCAIKSVV